MIFLGQQLACLSWNDLLLPTACRQRLEPQLHDLLLPGASR